MEGERSGEGKEREIGRKESEAGDFNSVQCKSQQTGNRGRLE